MFGFFLLNTQSGIKSPDDSKQYGDNAYYYDFFFVWSNTIGIPE